MNDGLNCRTGHFKLLCGDVVVAIVGHMVSVTHYHIVILKKLLKGSRHASLKLCRGCYHHFNVSKWLGKHRGGAGGLK